VGIIHSIAFLLNFAVSDRSAVKACVVDAVASLALAIEYGIALTVQYYVIRLYVEARAACRDISIQRIGGSLCV